MKPLSTLLAVCLLSSFNLLSRAAQHEFDVVVFGATPGGITAAVGAAREGVRVALVDPQEFVGNIMSGGLSFSDSNQTDRRALKGLFEEVHQRIEKHYVERGVELPYKVAEKNHLPWTYEPHVAEKVFNELLQEAGVRIFLGERLQRVSKEATRLTVLETEANQFRATTFVDATYEGDLLAKAGVSWTIGRESRAQYGESLAGRQYPKKPVPGVDVRNAKGALLPLMTADNAGADEAGDRRVMVYSFRLCLTKDDANKIPLQKPASYDPARYELVRRFVTAHPPQRLLLDLYPLPGGKFDGNNSIGGQISTGLVGGCNTWCEASYAERAKIWQEHRDYTEGLLWFMATDPAMPEALRQEMNTYGYPRDEFARSGGFPPALYVREGRRLLGEYVVTQRDIREQTQKEDSIAIGSFPIDSHDVQRVPAPGGGFLNEGTIFPERLPGRRLGQPHQLPYRAILPRRSECTNLLVPVALSCSHVAFSSIRVEPTWMALGQSAGIAAALTAKSRLGVQDLSYATLRARLLAQRQVLDLLALPELPPAKVQGGLDPATLPGLVLDDTTARKHGSWETSANFRPYIGSGYLHDGDRRDGRSRLKFQTTVPKTGRYQVRLSYSPHASRASNAPLSVQIAGTPAETFAANLREPLEGDTHFRTFATINLPEGQTVTITVSNQGTDGFVVLDAVQLLPAP